MRALLMGAFATVALGAPALADDFHPVDPENLLVLDTTKGQVIIELRPDIAPRHVERIRTLVRKGYYDSDVFYRVIPNFMDQTGEKEVNGASASGLGPMSGEFSFKPQQPVENVALNSGFSGDMAVAVDADGRAWPKFCTGVAGFGHYADQPDTADSQIFFMTVSQVYLDRNYTAWGRVISGQPALNAIAPGEPPPVPDRITKARIAADIPEAQRPKVSEADPSTVTFKAAISEVRDKEGDYFNICDVKPPVQIR
jgi:peptidylprolyl isomerase